MTATLAPEIRRRPRAHVALRSGWPSFAGLLVFGGLLPLRGSWAAGAVLVGLTFSLLGILALRAARVPSESVTAYPLYIPAAALVVVTVGGLLANLLGPSFGVAHPLRGETSGEAVLGLGVVLWLIGLRAPAAARFRWRSALGQPSLLAPLLLPVLSAAGALLLSNGHGPNTARVVAILTVVVLLVTLFLARRLSRGQIAMLIFACALATEWAFSIRSQEVIGFDITTEIQIAQHTHAAGIWKLAHPNDAYSAMLSLTVLPSTLLALTGITPLLAFKLLYPALAALIPVSVFLTADHLMRRSYAAGAGALLLVQYYFFQLLPELARQEIGLLFFAVLVAALLDRRLRGAARIWILVGASLGLVVSHYSSAYVAISTIVIAIVLEPLRGLRGFWRRSAPLLVTALALCGGAAIWYGPVTHSGSNFTGFTSSLQRNGLDLLPNRKGNFINAYLQGNVATYVSGPSFEQLAVRAYRGRRAYIHPLYSARLPQYRLQTATVPTPRISQAASNAVTVLTVSVSQLLILLSVIGGLVMLRRRNSNLLRTVGVLSLATLGVLSLERFSGTAAASYNQTRAILQAVILLALPAAWSAQWLAGRAGRLRRPLAGLMAVLIALFFAQQNGTLALAVGGGTSLNLAQSGEDYERQYMTHAEFAGAIWVTAASGGKLVYADPYGQFRIWATSGKSALTEVTPETLDRHAWVYGTHTNVVLGRGRGNAYGRYAIFRWPAAFLNTFWNTVYTNGQSRVYHR